MGFLRKILKNLGLKSKLYDFLSILCSIPILKCLSNFNPKFSNFFLGLYRTIEIFGNFLRIFHQIIPPICIFYSFLGLLKPKCLSYNNPKILKLFVGFHRASEIFG